MLKTVSLGKSLELVEVVPGRLWDYGDFAVGENGDQSLLSVYIGPGIKFGMEIVNFLERQTSYFTVCRLEDDCWTYRFAHGGEVVDSFATLPDLVVPYEGRNSWRGNPVLLSAVWNLEPWVAEKYLRWWRTPQDLTHFTEEEEDEYWDKLEISGKALESDECEYGDGWQMFDFVRAMGAEWPPKNDGNWLLFKVRDLA